MAWLPGYAYRKPLVITGGASGAQTDFQLDIDIAHVAAKMQADFDDIRFTQNNGTTLIDAWLESKVDSASAETRVEFPTTPANTVEQTYYMYYGKAVVNYWDIEATFLFGDDFPGTSLDLSKWTNDWSEGAGGTVTIENSILKIHCADTSSAGKGIKSVWASAPSYVFESRAKIPAINYPYLGLYKSTNTNPALSVEQYAVFRYISPNDITAEADGTNYAWDNQDWNNTIFNNFEIKRDSNGNSDFYVNGAVIDNDHDYSPTGVSIIRIASYRSTTDIEVDWVLIRKYAANPPTYAFGSEESAPTDGNPFWYYQLLRRRNQ